MEKTILIGLNELNFEYIEYYIKEGGLPNFKMLFDKYGYSETFSENQYELLEPWIQWVTVSTGMMYEDHKVFRLGDIVGRKDLQQIFEKIEENGYTVGAVSPFNVENRLKNPIFFAPDPWTETKVSGGKTFMELSNAVSQAVNDNAQGKLTPRSIKALIKGIAKYTSIKDYKFYLRKLSKIKSQVGVKALILDKLLADTFLYEWKSNKPDFSNLFLNSGAHFQHHYMFNSKAYAGKFRNPEWYCSANQDPIFDILKVYDKILGKLMKLQVRLVIATGLSQKPHKNLTYYWRINKHEYFLKKIGLYNYSKVIPRMSRDFLIEFGSIKEAYSAQKILESFEAEKDAVRIFTIDNRGKSLFVELTYPHDIKEGFNLRGNKTIMNFKKFISFVAIKNGEHDTIGYVLDTKGRIPKKKFPLKDLHNNLLSDFQNN